MAKAQKKPKKNPPGPKPSGNARQIFNIRLTSSELATLQAKADRAGKPLGTWLRELGLSH